MAVFAAVVRDGSFTAAARGLGITKQSVSERVARLEERLGVQLLVRTTRALRLTEVGTRYHEACAAIVAEAERAERDARAAQLHAAGTVRVTAPIGLGASLLVPAIAELQRAHPAVRVELVLDEAIVDLVRGGVDLAIRAGSVEGTATFVARPLFETPQLLVATPAFVARHGRPGDAHALAKLPCIARRIDDTWVIDGQRVAIAGKLTVNTFEAARDAALADLGIALVPAPVAYVELQAGRLVPVLRPGRTVKFTVLWPSRRLPARVRLFHDTLVHHAQRLARSIAALAIDYDRPIT